MQATTDTQADATLDAPDTTDDADAADDSSDALSKDRVFELLKNRRRREVLHYLYEHDGTASVSTLSEWIAGRENDVPMEEVTTTQRKRVYVGLYQTHLPKMADAGVVEYDEQTKRVALTDRAVLLLAYCHFDPTSGGGLLSRLFPNGR